MFRMMMLAGAGGFAGTCLRFLVNRYCGTLSAGGFPVSTFVVNIIGCFLIGLLFGLIEKHDVLTPEQNVFLITGFCGGFTTFSTFANEIWVLGERQQWIASLLFLVLSVGLGIFFVWAGRSIVR